MKKNIIFSDEGILYSKTGKKLEYKKQDNGYSFIVYKPIEIVIHEHIKRPYCITKDGKTTCKTPMDKDRFIEYLNKEKYATKQL